MKPTQLLQKELLTNTTNLVYPDTGNAHVETPTTQARVIKFVDAGRITERTRAKGVVGISDMISLFESEVDDGKNLLVSARKELSEHLYKNNLSLSALRMKSGMSQRDLAKKIDSTQSHIARIESGRNDPGRKIMDRICKELDIDMNTLNKALSQ
jgi:DNA-binding XRE family transcriptional regulator